MTSASSQTGQNKLSPMSLFSIANVKFPKYSCLFKKEVARDTDPYPLASQARDTDPYPSHCHLKISKVVEYSNYTGSTLDISILGVIYKVSIENTDFLWVCAKFYYRNDRERNGTFTGMCEALWKNYQYYVRPTVLCP